MQQSTGFTAFANGAALIVRIVTRLVGNSFQLGIIPKPPFADAMTHVFLSFDDVMEHRAEQIKAQLEAKQYVSCDLYLFLPICRRFLQCEP